MLFSFKTNSGEVLFGFNLCSRQDFIAFVSCYDDFFKGGKKRGIWVRAYSGFVWLGSYKPYRLSSGRVLLVISVLSLHTTISTLQKMRDHMTYMQIFGQLILQTLNILHISFLEQLIQG